jgi:hypothetical protein
LLFINPNDLLSTIGSYALWPGTAAILAGIDLNALLHSFGLYIKDKSGKMI